jgi:hypothetical protein
MYFSNDRPQIEMRQEFAGNGSLKSMAWVDQSKSAEIQGQV